jgi:hypothetical protein
MKTPRSAGACSLFALLLAAGVARAEPIPSDRLVITAADGAVVLDKVLLEGKPGHPERRIASGQLRVPHNALNVRAGVILTDPGTGQASDWLRLTVDHHKTDDVLRFVFRSDRDGKSLKIPKHFPAGAPRVAETGQLQDVTALLFPLYAQAGQAPPFTVQVLSDPDQPDPGPRIASVPAPASLALLSTGLLTLGGYAWRRRRARPAAVRGVECRAGSWASG